MPQPKRSRRVTVYHLKPSVKTRTGLAIRCRRLGAITVANRGSYGRRERMAAEAWVKCVGIRRREKLIEFGAPETVVRHETDVRSIAAMITPAPTEIGDGESYIYDNRAETWLMVIPLDELPVSTVGSRMHGIPRGDRVEPRRTSEALPWSLWFSRDN